MSYHINRKEFDEWVAEKAWDRLWSAYEYAISGSESPTSNFACFCSIIDGRRFLCGGCATKLEAELETVKDDNTDVRAANKRLQDELVELELHKRALRHQVGKEVGDVDAYIDWLLAQMREDKS